MNHTITTEDMVEALDEYILIASSISSKSRSRKLIWFKPSSLRYKVEFTKDKTMPVTDRFLDPIKAMSKYNEYVV